MNRKHWNNQATKLLQGKTIKSVRYLTAEEADAELGWEECGITMILDDGTQIVVSSDDEGNAPGALFVNDDILPTIRGDQ